jgi:hypothetical protein
MEAVEPVVERGAVLAYRLFDVGDAIDLAAAEKTLGGGRRVELSRAGAEAVQLRNPPLTVEIGKRRLMLPRGEREAQVSARIYDFGAVSVVMRLEVARGTGWDALLDFSDEVQSSGWDDEAAARAELAPLLARLGEALKNPHGWHGSEDYTVFLLEELRGAPAARELRRRKDLALLLLGEPPGTPLALVERRDVVKHALSYLDNDLVVVDWNSALVYEPSGSTDVLDVLETATAQLLELRYYDDLLDREMARIAGEIGRRRPAPLLRNYGPLARSLMARLVELAEFTERVENALKVTGDFYLARVYLAAVRRFRIRWWQAQVYRKQALVARSYELLKGEVDAARSQFLELLIIFLILWEILLAVLPPR